jgi:hypothetical protein
MEIKAPKTIHDLRIKHFNTLKNQKFENITEDIPFAERLDLMVDFVSGICSVDKELIYDIDIKNLNEIYLHCIGLFDKIPYSEPKKELKINGIEYKLVDPHTVATGWHVDWSKSDIEKDPVRIACLMYIPKDKHYSMLDSTGNLEMKIADRYKDFEEHLELVDFMNASRFFLLKWFKSKSDLEMKIKVQTKVQKILKRIGLNGKNVSKHYLNSTDAIGSIA